MNHLSHPRKYSASKLARAISDGEFVPFYQAQWRVGAGCVDSAEILARWQHPHTGLLSPVQFLPLLADNHIPSIVGFRLLNDVCRQLSLSNWLNSLFSRVSVNFTYDDITAPSFIDELLGIVISRKVEPARITIEITESHVFENIGKLRLKLDQLRSHGFKIALDDFCTGYSSLSHMKELPVDLVKIDRSFIRHLLPCKKTRSICAGIVQIAHQLGIEVTAEGVESLDQARLLQQIGCHYLQGFLIAKPMRMQKHSPEFPGFQNIADEGGTFVAPAYRQSRLALVSL